VIFGMTFARQALGREGEQLVCRELERRGYAVLARRYRTRHGELDIVARHRGTIVFVEVKTRRDRNFGDPADKVTWQKQRRLVAMAADYLARQGLEERPCRFDVAAVEAGASGTEITVFEDAFRPGW
jgi:putative endonuclease